MRGRASKAISRQWHPFLRFFKPVQDRDYLFLEPAGSSVSTTCSKFTCLLLPSELRRWIEVSTPVFLSEVNQIRALKEVPFPMWTKPHFSYPVVVDGTM